LDSGFSVSFIQSYRATAKKQGQLSAWAQSPAKRAFDLACVLCSLPLLAPLFAVTALAVRLTSRGPALFRQQRVGRGCKPFTIYKFRTMPVHGENSLRPALTTAANQVFTPIGPFLRRWKLDELPQIFNVLRGDMSLVGPRPKLPRLHAGDLTCRPGLTGRATVLFAREEVVLASVPNAQVDLYYGSVVRPLKQSLDDEYMARATFASDLRLILASIFRRWDDSQLHALLPSPALLTTTHHPLLHFPKPTHPSRGGHQGTATRQEVNEDSVPQEIL
jgi:lipopolysaccharide/colanic/teichoic acid biosynthesis glycosyltransferase